MGTELFGSSGYEESQTQHCDCKPNESVLPHYEGIINVYYALHVPEKAGHGKTIIENSKYAVNKGTSSAPMYALYRIVYELMKKYDNGIKHIEGRVGRNIAKPKKHATAEL
jgi:hypothetical protein